MIKQKLLLINTYLFFSAAFLAFNLTNIITERITTTVIVMTQTIAIIMAIITELKFPDVTSSVENIVVAIEVSQPDSSREPIDTWQDVRRFKNCALTFKEGPVLSHSSIMPIRSSAVTSDEP